MAVHRITKRIVDATNAETRDIFIWDAEAAGFRMKVTRSGQEVFIDSIASRSSAAEAQPGG